MPNGVDGSCVCWKWPALNCVRGKQTMTEAADGVRSDSRKRRIVQPCPSLNLGRKGTVPDGVEAPALTIPYAEGVLYESSGPTSSGLALIASRPSAEAR